MQFGLCSVCQHYAVDYFPETQNDICTHCGNVETESIISNQEIEFSKDDSHVYGESLTHEEGATGGLVQTNRFRGVRTINTRIQSQQRNIVAKKKLFFKIEQMFTTLGIPSRLKDEAFGMLSIIADGKFTREKYLDQVCGVCVYSIARLNEVPVTFLDIGECLGISMFKLGRVYRELYKVYPQLQVKSVDPYDLLTLYMEKLSTDLKMDEETESLVIGMSARVLRCTRGMWVNEGRRAGAITCAGIKIAFDGLKIPVDMSVLAELCKMGVNALRERFKEVQNIFLETAKKLPWGKNVTAKNYGSSVGMILTYLETCQNLIKDEIQIVQDAFLPPSFVRGRKEREKRVEQVRAAKKRIQNALDGVQNESHDLDGEDREMERLLLAGAKEEDLIDGNTYIQRDSIPIIDGGLEISERDLPDSQLDEYIKTPQEVIVFQQLEDQMGPLENPRKRKFNV